MFYDSFVTSSSQNDSYVLCAVHADREKAAHLL